MRDGTDRRGDVMAKGAIKCSRCENIRWCVILPDEGPVCPKCLVNDAYGREDQMVLRMRGFTRDYHSFPKHNDKRRHHRPYTGFLHSMDKDEDIPYKDNIHRILDFLPEGSVIEISIKVIGRDDRAIEDPVVWYDYQRYGILSQVPSEKQIDIRETMEEVGE